MRPLVPGLLLSPLVALCPLAALAQPPAGTDQAIASLLEERLLLPSDRVWLALPPGEPTAQDLAVADAFLQALTARGMAVSGHLGLAQTPSTGGFLQQLDALRALGVTKILSFGRTDDVGTVTVRLADVPGGWLSTVRTVNLSASRPPASPGAGSFLADAGLVSWNPKHGVGLQYSSLSGSGATYRHWFASGWGAQIAGIPAISVENLQTSGFVNLGVQGMRSILKTDRLRLYGLVGAGMLYRPNVTAYADPTPVTGNTWDLGLAPGLGLDYRVFDRVLLSGAMGYTFSRHAPVSGPPRYAYSPGFTLGAMIEW